MTDAATSQPAAAAAGSDQRATWADLVAGRFTADSAPITIAFDPDRVLAEEDVLGSLLAAGFEVVGYDDPIRFRYLYETDYRFGIERGHRRNLVMSFEARPEEAKHLPFDILSRANRTSLSLTEFFPELSYPVVEALEPADLGSLYEAVVAFRPRELNRQETIDFVLKHVYEVAPELLKRPADMLRFLARRHYRGLKVPKMFDDYIISTVLARGLFMAWPLEELLSDRETFFAFLQERWPTFLDQVARDKGLLDQESADGSAPDSGGVSAAGPKVPGPMDLPFGHDDVHVYIDDLFYAGYLKPVEHPLADKLAVDWLVAGLLVGTSMARSRNLEALLDHVAVHMPATDARHGDWIRFAKEWAELAVERWKSGADAGAELDERIGRVTALVDEHFTAWVLARYGGIHSLVADSPVMVHQVPGVMARTSSVTIGGKAALLVIDGMALDQWFVVKDVLLERLPQLAFETTGSYAWAPTLTSVSRQALLSGRVPRFFARSIGSTGREDALWRVVWAEHGVAADAVGVAKGLGEHSGWQGAFALLDDARIRVAAMIVNDVDEMAHASIAGTRGLHAQVRDWAEHSSLADLIERLTEQAFDVFITSDHGNVEARGIGNPKERAIADLRGERVRVYPNETLRDHVAENFPSAIRWDPVGLPDGFVPLLASGRDAFIASWKRSVTHGGASMEELIVPWVRVTQRESVDG